MNTLFGIGEEVFIKGIVKTITVSSNEKGKVNVVYRLYFPALSSMTGEGGIFKEENVYRIPDEFAYTSTEE